jgi:hypothetical protein
VTVERLLSAIVIAPLVGEATTIAMSQLTTQEWGTAAGNLVMASVFSFSLAKDRKRALATLAGFTIMTLATNYERFHPGRVGIYVAFTALTVCAALALVMWHHEKKQRRATGC